jgi:hypothetical protein
MENIFRTTLLAPDIYDDAGQVVEAAYENGTEEGSAV